MSSNTSEMTEKSSTFRMLGTMGPCLKSNLPQGASSNKSELPDAPKLTLQPGTDLGKQLDKILGANCIAQHTPME
jgi:hypothetical protein